jgi:hypothetical protein
VLASACTVSPDPAGRVQAPPDTLTRRQPYVHTVLGVLLGELTPGQRAVADRGIHTCYTRAGITTDPATWTRPAPLLADLQEALAGLRDPDGAELAHRLAPYTTGSFSGLFTSPTTARAAGHLTVFSLKDLPDELKAVGTVLALDATWRQVTNPADRRPRIVVADEAWLLMRQPAGAEFLPTGSARTGRGQPPQRGLVPLRQTNVVWLALPRLML